MSTEAFVEETADFTTGMVDATSRFPRATGAFLIGAAVALLITGLAKVATAFGEVQLLSHQDPLFSIFTIRQMIVIAGLLELSVATGVFGHYVGNRSKLALVAWLSTVFLAYRAGLWAIGYHLSCPCLGRASEVLHIPAGPTDVAMKVLLCALLSGSYGLLLANRRQPWCLAPARGLHDR